MVPSFILPLYRSEWLVSGPSSFITGDTWIDDTIYLYDTKLSSKIFNPHMYLNLRHYMRRNTANCAVQLVLWGQWNLLVCSPPAIGKQNVYHPHLEHDCKLSSIWISVISPESKRGDYLITWTTSSRGQKGGDVSVELLQDSKATRKARTVCSDPECALHAFHVWLQ